MFTMAKRWKVPGADTNPVSEIKLLDPNNARERYLSPEETRRLYAELEKSENPQLKNIISLLLLLGCRKRELLDAKWQEFDLERRSWRIPMSKTGKSRHVPLSQAALSVLSQLPRWEKCSYVVPNPKTLQPYTCVFRSWNTARRAAGLPEVRVHDIRHSAASYLINSGRSIYEVAKVLGHVQVKTTQRYAHLSQDTLLAAVDAAAEASGLDWGQLQETRAE
jgi:integrase